MNERRARTGEVLDAQEHAVLPGRRRHQHGPALALACLEGHAVVAHLAREPQALEAGQRLVDDNGAKPGRFVHDVGAVGLEVARRGLLDVEDAREALGRPRADLPQEVEDVTDVRAPLVEIQAVLPILDAPARLGLRGDPVDAERALDVPAEVLAAQLDLDAHQAVVADPLRERLGEAIADGLLHVLRLQGIEPADAVEERYARRRLAEQVAVEALTLELGAEVAGEVVGHQIGPVGGVDVPGVNLPEGVVEGRVEGAGHHEGAEPGDGLVELPLA